MVPLTRFTDKVMRRRLCGFLLRFLRLVNVGIFTLWGTNCNFCTAQDDEVASPRSALSEPWAALDETLRFEAGKVGQDGARRDAAIVGDSLVTREAIPTVDISPVGEHEKDIVLG
jgi:hypothetical protein